jgi:hypothetical protein
MTALLLLFVLPHVGGDPTPWQAVSGTDNVQYRWSRPASNSCLVEFENQDASQAAQFVAVATVVYTRPTNPVPTTGLAPRKSAPTIIKDKTEDREMPVHILRSGTYSASIDGCYRVMLLKASAPSSNGKTMTDKPGKAGAR